MVCVRALEAGTDRVVGVWGTLRECLATNPLQRGSLGLAVCGILGAEQAPLTDKT
jgi:hypothetical protein